MSHDDTEMFADCADDDGFEIDRDSSDRHILHAIWNRHLVGDLPADEGWAVLFERYPEEPRFLLLNLYEGLAQDGVSETNIDSFVRRMNRVTLRPHSRRRASSSC